MKNNTEKYFQTDGDNWLLSAYKNQDSLAPNRLRVVLEILSNLKLDSILDIGCGNGNLLKSLESVKRKMGLDYSQSMLDKARRNCPGLEFKKIDLNSSRLVSDLEILGMFDIATLLGVIHYLDSPVETLSAIRKSSLNNSGIMLVSFRNRLFNINLKSRYLESALTKKEEKYLDKECKFWANNSNINIELYSENIRDQKNIERIIETKSYNGITDNFWNPNKYEHWRQFTPLESLVLFNEIGLMPFRIIPISKIMNENLTLGINPLKNIAQASSFICLARLDSTQNAK